MQNTFWDLALFVTGKGMNKKIKNERNKISAFQNYEIEFFITKIIFTGKYRGGGLFGF